MQKKGRRNRRIKKEEPKGDLRIYGPNGKVIFVLGGGLCVDYQELLRRKSEKPKYKRFKGVF